MAWWDDFYSNQFAPWLRKNYPVLGRYAPATTPFRAVNILTHITNCLRPLNKRDAVWLEDISGRYLAEWERILTQVRWRGGSFLNPAQIPWIEVVLKLGLWWSLWVQVQQIAWGWLARRQLRRLRLRQWQVQCRLEEFLGHNPPRQTMFLDEPISNRSLLIPVVFQDNLYICPREQLLARQDVQQPPGKRQQTGDHRGWKYPHRHWFGNFWQRGSCCRLCQQSPATMRGGGWSPNLKGGNTTRPHWHGEGRRQLLLLLPHLGGQWIPPPPTPPP